MDVLMSSYKLEDDKNTAGTQCCKPAGLLSGTLKKKQQKKTGEVVAPFVTSHRAELHILQHTLWKVEQV